MTSLHPLPADRASAGTAPPLLAPCRIELREFGVVLLSVFLLGAGAVTAAILYETGDHGAGTLVAGPVIAIAAATPLWAFCRKRLRRPS